ncbi:MAG TPA: hypothetical protein VE127_10390 [Solirubrobacteraceae bacterium]|nr:hypothetical protein [Solirubrobacteraceae bacterium]
MALVALALPAAAQATTFGAEVNGEFVGQAGGYVPAAQALSSLQALYAAGGRVGRADSDWAATEPKAPRHGRHTYLWSYDDMIMSEMAQARLSWQPSLDFAPRWAEVHRSRIIHVANGRFVAFLPPANNANFAAYATAFMRRYGPRGAFWRSHRSLPYRPVTSVEVWNEPDNKHDWGNDINLQDYVKMYETVRTAVHRVDRRAQVATGGLAWTPSSLPRLLKALRRRPADAIAVHPYAATPKKTIAIARNAQALLRRYGRGRTPMLVNEYGWTSTKDTWGTTSPRNVDRYAYQALVGLAKLHVAEIAPFQWGSPTWGLSDGTFARALRHIHSHR